jgi:hypothetical protein
MNISSIIMKQIIGKKRKFAKICLEILIASLILSSFCMAWEGWEIPGWYRLGGVIYSNTSITKYSYGSDPDGYYHIYVKGSNGALWTRIHNEYEDKWTDVGGIITSDPVAISYNGCDYVFARGTDNALWVYNPCRWPTGELGQWFSLGGVITSNPTAIGDTNKEGVIDIFVRGADGTLWINEFDTSVYAGNWKSNGRYIVGNPRAAWDGVSKIRVFARDSDNSLMNLAYDSTANFNYWWPMSGVLTSDPKPVSIATSNPSIFTFARGTDGQMWLNIYDSTRNISWWVPLGGYFKSGFDPEPVIDYYYGLVNIYGVGSDGGLWRKILSMSGGQVEDWKSFGGYLTSNPDGVYRFGVASGAYVAARGSDNSLWLNSNNDA